eukprot:14364538-Alexandrium_andersonii.AAC.1
MTTHHAAGKSSARGSLRLWLRVCSAAAFAMAAASVFLMRSMERLARVVVVVHAPAREGGGFFVFAEKQYAA